MSGYLLKAFRAQEIARERNKREDRKLNLNLSGRNGPEAVCRFNMDKVNKEQKAVARELGRIRTMAPTKLPGDLQTLTREQTMAERQLEKIRQGIHKPANKALLTPDKQFHHPVFNFTDIPESESNTNSTLTEMKKSKETTNPSADLKSRTIDRQDSVVDGFMIIKYLGDLHNNTQTNAVTPPPSERIVKSPVYRSQIHHNQQIDTDIPRLAFKRLTEIGKIDSDHAERSHTGVAQANTQQAVVINSGSTGTDARSRRGADLGVARVPREHGQRAAKNQHQHYPSASLIVPETTLRSESRSSSYSNLAPTKPAAPLDLAALASLDMANVRTKVSKRLSTDSALSDPGSNRKQNNRKGSTSVGQEVSSASNNNENNVPIVKPEVGEVQRHRPPERRMSKQQIEELLRKPVYDPETYNADGSLKTMHMLPNFDRSWEEAQKARYVRTKEPLERDRELTTKEIFSQK